MFDLFWFEHPRKVGKPKAEAAFAAALARGIDPQVIVDGMRRHLPAWSQKKANGEGDKIPHPSTWLNRDGWNDEVMPPGTALNGARTAAPTARERRMQEALGPLGGKPASELLPLEEPHALTR